MLSIWYRIVMPKKAKPYLDRELFMTPKEGAFMAGISTQTLYIRCRKPNPPPHKRRGTRILLPRAEFTEWATQDVIE